MAKPDFLVIGAQKAGTTWLYSHLKDHPDVSLPPVKEIHYFDRGRRPLILDAFRAKHQRVMLWRWLKPALLSVPFQPAQLAWNAHFFLQPRSHTWYEKCFQPSDDQLVGDITPAYARLDGQAIAKAAKLLPDAKVIYILRDPIERMWSQAAMYFSRFGQKGLGRYDTDEIRQFLNWDMARANSDYIANIDRWHRHFPKEQMHIAFFDQLQADPSRFLAEICEFLQIAPPAPDAKLSERIHARSYPQIPASLLADLRVEYLPMIQELDKRFATKETGDWLARVQGMGG